MEDMGHSPTFPLNEWLPLEQAAHHLSSVIPATVRAADILRFALDAHLKLSVRFPNFATVKRGEIIQFPHSQIEASIAAGVLPGELKWQMLPPTAARFLADVPEEAEGQPFLKIRNLKLDDERYVKFGGKVKTISGLWDLPMIGGEMIDVEERYQQLTGGPNLISAAMEGVVVEGRDGELYQLQEQFNVKEYSSVWDQEHRELKQQIAAADIPEEEAEKLLDSHKKERKQILQTIKALSEEDSFYPAGRLPKDSTLVVRREALIEFEKFVKQRQLNSCNPADNKGEHRVPTNSCQPATAAKIIQYFKVKRDPDENAEWWKDKMREANRNGLAGCRVGEGRKGPGGSSWRPDDVAAWLVDRHEKDHGGLSLDAVAAALRKFPGCNEAADRFFQPDE
ncbi:hypothetical protein [Nitrosovibrio sp. Nv6]|uniref:hypothetical protein n=1 Tax=Nitrosovibrio sp. Nv6 TaxID=1855340 RepID=UPI00115F97BF|nr:hypothetical protein [Nitrosovibrio sp. Nv6]